MGNCQAIDNATLMIQHPCGRVDKLYWPVTASEIMKMNPGHYVALLLTTTTTTSCPSSTTVTAATTATTTTTTTTTTMAGNGNSNSNNINSTSVRITRIKLLRPTDTLILGQVYRLVTNEEVMKGLWTKKYAKMKKKQSGSAEQRERIKEKLGPEFETVPGSRSDAEKTNQVPKHERHRQRPASSAANSTAAKSRPWQPSLKSISEAAS